MNTRGGKPGGKSPQRPSGRPSGAGRGTSSSSSSGKGPRPSSSDRPRASKPAGSGPSSRPGSSDRPRTGKPSGSGPSSRPGSSDRPRTGKPSNSSATSRPGSSDRPRTGKPSNSSATSRPGSSDRPRAGKPSGSAPSSRPGSSDRPRTTSRNEGTSAPRSGADRPSSPRGGRPASGGAPKRYGAGAQKSSPYSRSGSSSKPYRGKSEEPRDTPANARPGIRLNRYLSQAGIASRREADALIAAGLVMVNGQVVTEMGFMVQSKDVVRYGGETIRSEKPVYLLLNKPKGFITTTDDPKARKTVMDLVAGACKERIFPVGRLDRPTTGLLLFTNDGDLAEKLMHPSHRVKKIYEVVLDKNLSTSDFDKIVRGVTLEDGLAEVDKLSYVEGKTRNHLGIEIHIGRNRIVRRIFESLGYEVVKLDRVFYAGLTKKQLTRGQWRFLNPQEVNNLKML